VDAAGVEETMQAERAVIESASQRAARIVSAVAGWGRLSSRYMHRSRPVTETDVVKGDSETAMHVDAAEVEETMQAERAVIESASQRAARIVSAVAGLEEKLKEHQMQLDHHAEQREELTAMLAAKDQELVDASMEVEERSVQLRAVEDLRGCARKEEARRQAGDSAKVAELERMKAQVAGLTEQRTTCLSKSVRKETREASLRKQISIISRNWSHGGQGALSKSRRELQEVRQEARALKREETSLTRALQWASLALEREQKEARTRAAEEAQLEEQLQAWGEELSERNVAVSAAADHKFEICRQRNILLDRLRELDRRDDAYTADAAEVECLLGDLLASAKKARSTALRVQRPGNTKRHRGIGRHWRPIAFLLCCVLVSGCGGSGRSLLRRGGPAQMAGILVAIWNKI